MRYRYKWRVEVSLSLSRNGDHQLLKWHFQWIICLSACESAKKFIAHQNWSRFYVRLCCRWNALTRWIRSWDTMTVGVSSFAAAAAVNRETEFQTIHIDPFNNKNRYRFAETSRGSAMPLFIGGSGRSELNWKISSQLSAAIIPRAVFANSRSPMCLRSTDKDIAFAKNWKNKWICTLTLNRLHNWFRLLRGPLRAMDVSVDPPRCSCAKCA